MSLTTRMCLNPLIAICAGGGRGISQGEEALGILVCVGVGRNVARQRQGTPRVTRYCLLDEEVSGFRSVSLFPVHSHSVFTTRGEGKLAYHAHTGNLYTKKSPTATNSSVAHEQKDVNM